MNGGRCVLACFKCDGECTHLAHNQYQCLPGQIPTLRNMFVHIVYQLELVSNVNEIIQTMKSALEKILEST